MEKTKDAVLQQKSYLEKILKQLKTPRNRNSKHNSDKNQILSSEYKLRTSVSNGKTQYYLLHDGKRKYITKERIAEARQKAQQEYERGLIPKIEKRISELDKIQKALDEPAWMRGEVGMCEAKKKLITPVFETDEEYALKWQSVEYYGKNIDDSVPYVLTDRGERVRSKSEKIIADKLFAKGIPYRYEYPIKTRNGIVYPDFCMLNVRTRKEWYLEHLGMMDNPQYSAKNVWKIEQYEKENLWPGEGLLLTYETADKTLDTQLLEKMLDKYLL